MRKEYNVYPHFMPQEYALSLVSHHHTVAPGSRIKIVKPWYGGLCAVQMPDGEFHRWFAWFELEPDNPQINSFLSPGSYAIVISTSGHGDPPHVPIGTRVQILRCFPNAIYYDTILENGEYHRWLADFELVKDI